MEFCPRAGSKVALGMTLAQGAASSCGLTLVIRLSHSHGGGGVVTPLCHLVPTI